LAPLFELRTQGEAVNVSCSQWDGRRVAGALLLVLGLGIPAGPAGGATLEEALVAAYQNNPRLLAARAELRAVDESVPQALSNWRPNVTGNVEAGKSRVESRGTTLTGAENRTPRSADITVQQPLFRGFRTLNETKQAEHQVRAQRALLLATEQQVLLDGVTVYMGVVRDKAVLELNVSNVQVLQSQLQATRDRFSVGEVTRTDVAQAEARLSRAQADRVRAEGDLDTSRAAYLNVIGEVARSVTEPQALTALPAALEEVQALATEQDPELVAAKFVERAARDNVDVVGGELLPSVNLNGTVSRAWDTNARDGRSDVDSVVARLTVPLYQSGAVTSRLRQAKQVVSQRRLEIAVARRNALEDATSAWEVLQTSRAQVRAFSAEAEANRIALEGVRQEANAGLRTVLDILDAEQELLDSQVNLVRARRDEIVAGYALLTTIGRLTAMDIGLPVEVYDATGHYDEVRNKPWGLGESLKEPAEP